MREYLLQFYFDITVLEPIPLLHYLVAGKYNSTLCIVYSHILHVFVYKSAVSFEFAREFTTSVASIIQGLLSMQPHQMGL